MERTRGREPERAQKSYQLSESECEVPPLTARIPTDPWHELTREAVLARPPPSSWRDAIFLTQLIHQANGKLSFPPNSPFTLSPKKLFLFSFHASHFCRDQGFLRRRLAEKLSLDFEHSNSHVTYANAFRGTMEQSVPVPKNVERNKWIN